MRTQADIGALIAALADDLTPVRHLRSPWIRCARWLSVAAVLAGIGVVLLGMSSDVRGAIHDSWFAAHVAVTLVMAALAAAVAFVLSVPDATLSRSVRWLPVGVGLAWVVFLAGRLVLEAPEAATAANRPPADACATAVASVALLPAALVLVMIRRAAPLSPAWSAGLGAAGAGGLAACGTYFHCLNVEAAHALVSHVGPVTAFALGGAFAGLLWQHTGAPVEMRRLQP